MAYPANWIVVGGVVISFAEYDDFPKVDQRVFEANEGLTSTDVEEMAEKSTQRILNRIRTTAWWQELYRDLASTNQMSATQTLSTPYYPLPDANNIQARQADFTDLCVYHTLYEYLYPKIADFNNQDSAEVQKIGVFRTKFDDLFKDLIQDGSWYDFSGDGTITNQERLPTRTNLVRIR
jgi:hypothetical protein